MRKVTKYSMHTPPYDNAVKLKYQDKKGVHEVKLACGTHDDVEIFREGQYTYALSWNDSLGYVGLEKFNGNNLEGNIFLQDSQHVEECLGKRGLDLSPMTIVKKLAEYLY